MDIAQGDEGKAVVQICSNGIRALEPVDGEVSLELMYARLNCRLVEVVRLSPTVDMWVDEEALAGGRPFNPLATALAAAFGVTHQGYHGPALVCGSTPEGASVGLDWETARNLAGLGESGPSLAMPSPRRAPDFRVNGGGL